MIKLKRHLTIEEKKERDSYLNFIRYDLINGEFEERKIKKAIYRGGSERFKYLDVHNLKKLIDLGYINQEERHNNAPTNIQFLKFMEAHPEFLAYGFAIDSNRNDCRVSIEGVEHIGNTSNDSLTDFYEIFSKADEFLFDENRQYCWYD